MELTAQSAMRAPVGMAAAREPLWDSRLPIGLWHSGVVRRAEGSSEYFLYSLRYGQPVQVAFANLEAMPTPSSAHADGDADACFESITEFREPVLVRTHSMQRTDPPTSSLASLRAQPNIRMRRRSLTDRGSVFGPTRGASLGLRRPSAVAAPSAFPPPPPKRAIPLRLSVQSRFG